MTNGRPKMLIIGSRGFLGCHLTRVAASEFAIVEGNRTTNGKLNEIRVDLEDKEGITRAFDQVRPDVVLLLAAHSDIDYCEQHPEEAWAVNLRGAEHVALACINNNA